MNLDALVTHSLPLENAVEAIELCAEMTKPKPSVKVQIVDDEDDVI